MALEVTEEKEENLAEPIVLDADAMKVFKQMQERIEELEKNGSAPSGGSDNMEALVKLLADKIGDQEGHKVGQFQFGTMHTMADIDEKDVLPQEEWVTFITHKALYAIVDDKRHGKNVRAPLDKILFKYQSTQQVKAGKEVDIVQLSTYTCMSRTELKWLKDHSLFGITFFTQSISAISKDVERGMRIAKVMTSLSGMNQHQLVNMARERKLPVGGDLGQLRGIIANFMVDKDLEKRSEATKNILLEQKLEADLIEKEVQ
jgi:hypothetical protein